MIKIKLGLGEEIQIDFRTIETLIFNQTTSEEKLEKSKPKMGF